MGSNINIKYILIKTFKKNKNVEEKNIITETDLDKEPKLSQKAAIFFYLKIAEIRVNVKKNIFEIPKIKLLEKNNHQKI